MEPYHINEGALLFPQGYDDDTTHVIGWASKIENSSSFNLTINRDVLSNQQTLSSYVDEQIPEMKNHLDSCELISRKLTRIDNLPAEQIEFTWQSEDGVMAQRQTFVVHGRKVLIFTGTMSVRFTREGARLWEHLLDSFKFCEGMK